VSVTDDVRAVEPRSEEPRRAEGPFERTPPQDVAAEQCVLGGMLLSKDAIADVVEILKGHDFYRPSHTTVFDAILDLYGRGEPADPITVAAALADSGELARVGGAAYLHTLIASVPTAANAAYYARIVADRAVLRRLVEAGTRIVQLGYGASGNGGRDVDDLVDLAQQAVYDVTERRVSEDFAVLAEILQPTLDEIEAVGAQGGVMTGVPTGFTDLDRLLNGLHPGQLVIVAGRPGLGKALALDTPLPTPDGWTTMGAVRAGDRLLGADGRPTTVVRAFDVLHGRPCYEVEFSDGAVIVADAEHLWLTTARASGREPAAAVPAGQRSGTAPAAVAVLDRPATARPGVVTTAQLAASLRGPAGGRVDHAVGNCRPLALPPREDLPVPPYGLGRRLGTGHAAAVLPAAADHAVPGRGAAASGGRIPAPYLRSAEAQRRALLAGLLDAAGTVTPTGDVQLAVGSRGLAEDVRELVVSLGYRCAPRPAPVPGRGPATPDGHTVTFAADGDVFRLARKRVAHRERRGATDTARTASRYVVDVRPVPSVPVRCVTVDNDDHLYLAGRAMIPTHNSTAAMDFSRSASVKHNMASAIFSLEMSKVEIVMRLLSAEARVPLHVLRSGQLSDDDWTKLARRMGEISEAPLFVDDTPNMNLMEIRAKARRLKQRHDLKLIVVDYLQLMTSPKRTESRQQEVADLSRGLKLLAKEVECPVVAVSQLNRGPEQRTDKRPQLSDLRESGCLPAGTRVLRADTNEQVTLGELLASGARDVPVWALDERLKYVPATMTHAFPSGRRPVYRLTLASGKRVEATANHPFLTYDGWRPLGELATGARLAVPRHVPPPAEIRRLPDAEVVTLARLLGAAPAVPAAASSLPKEQVALLLRHLWGAAGSVAPTHDRRGGRVCLTATSRRLLEDVSLLLLRFGIASRLRTASPATGRARYTLDVCGRDDQLRFLREIGAPGRAAGACAELLMILEGLRAYPTADTVPNEVWGRVRQVLTGRPTTRREPVGQPGSRPGGTDLGRPGPGRQRLARVAAVLEDAELELVATNDVLWDEVVAIESVGEQDVYDATVLGLHNFVADGVAVHNSIEQDADVVILLHRDDYYDKESPRAGEADFIVAKHRNGPTDTITVAAQLHLSRFVDMAVV
jgi:replicative DNA helicase